MAKRFREEDPTASQVVTEERGTKRHAAADSWHQQPENSWKQLSPAPPGWPPPPASKQLGAAPPLPPPFGQPHAGEPLRPANQADAAAAAAVGTGAPGPLHLQQQPHQPQGEQHAAAAAAAAAAALGHEAAGIDWHNPEQVARLLRLLHLERLHRLGQQLPAEYQHTQ